MDTTDIVKLCETLSLSEKDGPIASLDSDLRKIGSVKLTLSLVGKVISNKAINREAFRSIIPKIWKTTNDIYIEVLSNNIYVFYFRSMEDRKQILAGEPWNFDNSLLVLGEPTGNGDLGNMKFSNTEFWVQVYNVPLVCMTREIDLFLGRQIGEVCELDLGATGDCLGKFLRIRVRIDISRPLQRCIRVDLDGSGKACTMLLRYERLSEFCFQCGHIGHATRECVQVDCFILAGTQKFEYGGWLRATSPVRVRRSGTQPETIRKKEKGEMGNKREPVLD
ncbi:hypothetical protein ACOSQ4_023064 [Xanthoceras sorbifolium]